MKKILLILPIFACVVGLDAMNKKLPAYNPDSDQGKKECAEKMEASRNKNIVNVLRGILWEEFIPEEMKAIFKFGKASQIREEVSKRFAEAFVKMHLNKIKFEQKPEFLNTFIRCVGECFLQYAETGERPNGWTEEVLAKESKTIIGNLEEYERQWKEKQRNAKNNK